MIWRGLRNRRPRRELVEAAFKGGGLHLIDVPIDYSENIRVLVDELQHRVKEIELD